MPNLGSGLSLGAISRIPGFDFDASNYIISNNIPNSTSVISNDRNYYHFDGTGTLQFSNSANSDVTLLELKGTKSFSVWFKPDNFTNIPVFGRYLFGKEMNYGLRMFSNTQIGLAISYNGSGWVTYDITLPITLQTGTWYHIGFCYNSSTFQTRIFFNGSVIDTRTLAQITQTPSTSEAFFLGNKSAGGSGTTNWVGGLKHLSVWNKDLTTAEIAILYNGSGVGAVGTLYNILESSWSGLLGTSALWYPCNQSYIETSRFSLTGGVTPNSSESSFSFVNPQTQINNFIIGLKNLGYWNNCLFYLGMEDYTSKTGSIPSLGGYGNYPMTSTHFLRAKEGIATTATSHNNRATISGSNLTLSEICTFGCIVNWPSVLVFNGYPQINYFGADSYATPDPQSLGSAGTTGRNFTASGSVVNPGAYYPIKFVSSYKSTSTGNMKLNNSSVFTNSGTFTTIGRHFTFFGRMSGGNVQSDYGPYGVGFPQASFSIQGIIINNNSVNLTSLYDLFKSTIGSNLFLP